MGTTMREVQAVKDARSSIVFYAIGYWDAGELQRFVAALSAMYALLLVASGEIRPGGEVSAIFRRSVLLTEGEVAELPLSALDLLRPETARDQLLRQMELEYLSTPTKRLWVGSIQIADPGTAIFTGVAPVIALLRDFLKTLWCRNRTERDRQELAHQNGAGHPWEAQMTLRAQQVVCAAQYLRGQARYGELAGRRDPHILSQAAAIFARSVEDLDDLVASGRILEVPERLADAE